MHDEHVHVGEEAGLLAEDGVRLLDETAHEAVLGGGRGVDGDDEVADALLLGKFHWFHEWQVAV